MPAVLRPQIHITIRLSWNSKAQNARFLLRKVVSKILQVDTSVWKTQEDQNDHSRERLATRPASIMLATIVMATSLLA
jgi:hypothetical protein